MTATDQSVSDVEDIFELSPMQLTMLFQTLLAPDAGTFFEQQVMPLPFRVDTATFEAAWADVLHANSVLRTSFHWEEIEKPVQVVHSDMTLAVTRLDWTDRSRSERDTDLEHHLARSRRAGFQMDAAPLIRIELIDVGPRETWFVWHFHHILLDGWSGQLLLADLAEAYSARTEGRAARLLDRGNFRDYIEWLQRQSPQDLKNFWRRRLQGLAAPTQTGLVRGSGEGAWRTGNDGEVRLEVGKPETAELAIFAKSARITLNTLFHGAWAVLLARYSGTREVQFGTVVSGRPPDMPGADTIIGLFINVLPTRIVAPGTARLRPWLDDLQAKMVETSAYQHVTIKELRQWSEFPPGAELFESVLIFENFPVAAPRGAGNIGGEPLYLGRTNVPITVIVVPGPSIRLKILFDDKLIDRAAVDQLAAQLRELVLSMARQPDRKLSQLSMLPEAERQKLLVDWNATALPGFDAIPIAARLADVAATMPERTAFTTGDQTITFGALDRRTSELARALLDRGIEPGSIVGVCLPRSIAAVEAFYAILKARAVYLPLDPEFPAERISAMIRNADPVAVLTEGPNTPKGVIGPTIDISAISCSGGNAEPHLPPAAPADPAYVIHTSGSTGKPKAIIADHRQMLNRLAWMWQAYPWTDHEVAVMRTSLNFVDSFWEMLGATLRGVPVAIAPGSASADPDALVSFLAEHRVTRIWFVPSLLELLLDAIPDLAGRLPDLTFWSSGGEPLTGDLYHRFVQAVPHGVLYNTLGASEVWDCTFFDPTVDAVGPDQVPVGRPISNTTAYILDNHNQPSPVGVTGELALGGACLSHGYLDRGKVSFAGRIVELPYDDALDRTVFRTGDLARYRGDGVIEYVGRADQQIKLRGVRIEPAEIEAALRAHPSIDEAVVAARGNGATMRLVAWLKASGAIDEDEGLAAFLTARLPAHMVPRQFVPVANWPRTPTGKINRAGLTAPEPDIADTPDVLPPQNDLEVALCSVFREVLGIRTVHREAHFFNQLGGHSLLAARLVSRLRERFQIDLPLRTIFEAPTIATLAPRIEAVLPGARAISVEDLLGDLEDLSPEEIDALLEQLENDTRE